MAQRSATITIPTMTCGESDLVVITLLVTFVRLSSMVTVSPMHKFMEQRAGKKYQPRQRAKQVTFVVTPEQDQRNPDKNCQSDFITSIHH